MNRQSVKVWLGLAAFGLGLSSICFGVDETATNGEVVSKDGDIQLLHKFSESQRLFYHSLESEDLERAVALQLLHSKCISYLSADQALGALERAASMQEILVSKIAQTLVACKVEGYVSPLVPEIFEAHNNLAEQLSKLAESVHATLLFEKLLKVQERLVSEVLLLRLVSEHERFSVILQRAVEAQEKLLTWLTKNNIDFSSGLNRLICLQEQFVKSASKFSKDKNFEGAVALFKNCVTQQALLLVLTIRYFPGEALNEVKRLALLQEQLASDVMERYSEGLTALDAVALWGSLAIGQVMFARALYNNPYKLDFDLLESLVKIHTKISLFVYAFKIFDLMKMKEALECHLEAQSLLNQCLWLHFHSTESSNKLIRTFFEFQLKCVAGTRRIIKNLGLGFAWRCLRNALNAQSCLAFGMWRRVGDSSSSEEQLIDLYYGLVADLLQGIDGLIENSPYEAHKLLCATADGQWAFAQELALLGKNAKCEWLDKIVRAQYAVAFMLGEKFSQKLCKSKTALSDDTSFMLTELIAAQSSLTDTLALLPTSSTKNFLQILIESHALTIKAVLIIRGKTGGKMLESLLEANEKLFKCAKAVEWSFMNNPLRTRLSDLKQRIGQALSLVVEADVSTGLSPSAAL